MVITQFEISEQNIARATVELAKEEFEKALNTVYLKNRNRINVPGFRRGKAPRKMMEKIYGEGLFWEDAMNEAIPEVMRFVTTEKELKPIGQSWVDNADKNEETGLIEITMNIPNYPKVELESYSGLSAVKKTAEVAETEIDAKIEEVRKRNSRLVTCDRAAKLGDTVVIDYVGYIDNQPFQGGKGEGTNLELGSHQFIDTYEVQLIGSKAGDDVEVSVKFPFDYHTEQFRDKDAIFKVHVHEVKEAILPELDDEFAKDVSEFETLAEYRESIRAELLVAKQDKSRDEFYDKIMEQLVDSAKINLHESVIDEQAENMLAQQSASMGIGFETYMQMFNLQNEEVKASIRSRAEKNMRIELILREIADRENIELTDEDKEAQYAKLAESYGVDAESVKTFVNPDSFEHSALMRKIADRLIELSVELPEPEGGDEELTIPIPEAASDSSAEPDAEADEAQVKPKRTRKKAVPAAEPESTEEEQQ